MKCEEVKRTLVFYLDGELPSDEKRLVSRHLATCSACQAELAALSAVRKQTGQALQRLADQSSPSPQAWSRLQARLAKETQPSQTSLQRWFSRLAPGGGSTHTQTGENNMQRIKWISALAAVFVIAVAAFFITKNVTPVSAQQILQRAASAQSTPGSNQAIHHTKIESYSNINASPNDGAGAFTISESYVDPVNGFLRQVITDEKTGKVLYAFAYDGSFTYSSPETSGVSSTEPITIYRTPQNSDRMTSDLKPMVKATTPSQLFDTLRSDPNVKVRGKETWIDGRDVYVLTASRPIKVLNGDSVSTPQGTNVVIFDAATYRIVEEEATVMLDENGVTVSRTRVLADEYLPAGSPVTWGLDTLQGVTIVDDPNRTMGDLLPEKITPVELATHTTAYLLKTTPAGYELEITAPPQQDHESSYKYIAAYRSSSGEYFVMQAEEQSGLPGEPVETYQTSNGLTLQILYTENTGDANHAPQITIIFAMAPDGTTFTISSTLPLDQIKAWAEDLAPIG